MNTLLPWIQPTLWFLFFLALTAMVRLVCYLASCRLNAHWPDDLLRVELTLMALSIGILFIWPSLMFGAPPILAICIVGTFAERAIHPNGGTWRAIWLRIVITTLACLILSTALLDVLLLLARSFGLISFLTSVGSASFFSMFLRAVFGAFCSPSVIPVFLWMWQSSQIHPGQDRHLSLDKEYF